MKIQKSVKKAIDEMAVNDFESAMIHVCSAIDGTARKKIPILDQMRDSQNLFVVTMIYSVPW